VQSIFDAGFNVNSTRAGSEDLLDLKVGFEHACVCGAGLPAAGASAR
jgi:hypothetical protein